MATYDSTQVAQLVQAAPRKLYERDSLGTIRILSFDFTVPSGNIATGSIVRCRRVPRGCYVVDYWFGFEAMTTGAGTAGADYGITGDGQRYLTAFDMDAAGEKRAAYVENKMPDRTVIADDATYFIVTVTGEAWAATKVLEGKIEIAP